MTPKQQLARQGLLGALQVRQSHDIMPWQALCVFDLAEQCGASVRFDDVNSMEGTYAKAKSTIMIPTHRPFGRKAFTGAHELAHHHFGHSFHIDQLMEFAEREFNPEDFLADCFAGFLLMPKLAVDKGFTSRGWSVAGCTPEQAFVVAGWLGVGYETLLKHMRYSLRNMPAEQAGALLRTAPKSIRASLLGSETAEDVFVVDTAWVDRAVDVQVGDYLIAPAGCSCERSCIEPVGSNGLGLIFRGARPGTGRLVSKDQSWAAHVRVSRRDFVGWSFYRHLEEPDDGQDE
jgi:Zn-dependent peptidase ImmA (M78 family)